MKKKLYFILLIPIFLVCFSCENDKIKPGFTKDNHTSKNINHPKYTTLVEKKEVTQTYEAVGTIRPLTESVIESQISAQVIKISCVPGMGVKKGQLLISLDARRLSTQLKQAQEGLAIAKKRQAQAQKSIEETKAGLDQSLATYNRSNKLFSAGVVSSQKLEIDKSAYLQAKARLEKSKESKQAITASIRQAQEVVKEARIAKEYSRIVSPSNGVVVKRMIDPGDLAVPGKPLLIIQTSGALRLEANIREGLISQIVLGKDYQVKIKTIDKTVLSKIEEIVPYADPTTRTFLVKASLPLTPGIYPGMFGRLLIPVKKDQTLLIPAKAVILVGQLELVYVKKEDSWQSVYIKTGKKFNEKIEVLAGLVGNETIGYKE
ncbi:MAG: efflux RND transporter periplasmic adaptor subunit [Desulfobacteraceae bacterium]|nr:efflux RND transporter periplasmic adaptor subunit [Desulfobacteraceae bacterium]